MTGSCARDGRGYGALSETESVKQLVESFSLIAFTFLPGFVTALSNLRGPLPAWNALAFFLPAVHCNLAGKCPLYARAIVIVESFRSSIFSASLVEREHNLSSSR